MIFNAKTQRREDMFDLDERTLLCALRVFAPLR
jgi:hypothetical protein